MTGQSTSHLLKFIQDWLHEFPRLFTDTSELIHVSFFHFLVVGSVR